MRSLLITEKKEIETIIAQHNICFIGITTKDREPYVIPMNFGYHNGVFIFHTASESSFLEALKKQPKICITMCTDGKIRYQNVNVACSYSMEAKSVICKATTEIINDDEEKIKYMNILMKNYTDKTFTYSAPAIRNVIVFIAKVDEMTGKAVGLNFKD